MKLCVKRIYCPGCQRLVRGREELVNSRIHISCGRCRRTIWLWDDTSWRYAGSHITERQTLIKSRWEDKGDEAVDVTSVG